jgi:pyridoxal phosphate enzyme (YggS family)
MPVNLHALEHIKEELKPFNADLVAVSKTKTASDILEVYNAGQRIFGENYVQELADKYEELPKDIKWHFIGHLQTNKVKYIAPFVILIHGVDSFNLLKEINKQAIKANRILNCLLQIHIAQDETKFGFSYKECEELLESRELSSLKNVFIKGFMGMATLTDNIYQIQKEFYSLSEFYLKMQLNCKPTTVNCKLEVLSIGMTSDYKIALSAGSNMVRIGSAIFGERE